MVGWATGVPPGDDARTTKGPEPRGPSQREDEGVHGIKTACSASPAAPPANGRRVTVNSPHHTSMSENFHDESIPYSPPVAARPLSPRVVAQSTSLSAMASRSVPHATLTASASEHARDPAPSSDPHVAVDTFTVQEKSIPFDSISVPSIIESPPESSQCLTYPLRKSKNFLKWGRI